MEPTILISGDGPAGRSLPPELLRQVNELHELVRRWAEIGSRAGLTPFPLNRNSTVAYLDLMFAYGLARLGEVQRSVELAEAARAALDTFPAGTDEGIAARFLARAFQYRIDQAAAGQPLFGRLSPGLLDELDDIEKQSKGIANSPHGLAHFVITRMRQQSSVLEPSEHPDPYQRFTVNHEGGLKKDLYELIDERDPERLAACVRKLYRREGVGDSRSSMTEGQFDVLRDCLPLSGRVGSEFATELIRLVPDAVRQSFPKQMELPWKQAQLLERGLSLAGHFGHRELAVELTGAFTELVAAKTNDERLNLINRVTGACVRCLRKFDLRDDLDQLLQRLHTAVLGSGSLNDLKANYGNQPERWMWALQATLNIAGGWLTLGLTDQANPILDEARTELLSPPPSKGEPLLLEITQLATTYIATVGQGPAESGLQRIAELFRKIRPNKITNAFRTAPFFSRLHLNVAEAVVLAILQMLPSSLAAG